MTVVTKMLKRRIRNGLLLVGLSAVLVALLYKQVITGSYFVALIPAIYAFLMDGLFNLVADATYFGNYRLEEDMTDRQSLMVQGQMRDAVTLDAESFLRSIRAEDERAGRA